MVLKSYEFKAAARKIESLEKKMLELNPVFKGEDHQADSYFDKVAGLGTFIEVEAIAEDPGVSTESLKKQCDEYISLFGIYQSAFIGKSYCDLLTEKSEGKGRLLAEHRK